MKINEVVALMIGTVGVLNVLGISTKIQNKILKLTVVVGSIWILFIYL